MNLLRSVTGSLWRIPSSSVRIISLRLVSSINTIQAVSNHDNTLISTPPTNEAPPTMMDTSIAAVEFQSTAPGSHDSPSFMNDPLAMKFINCMMRDGKKGVSQRTFKRALEVIKIEQLKKLQKVGTDVTVETDPMVIFHTALKNVSPVLGTKSVKRGGKSYQVPSPLHDYRRRFLSMKWLITAATDKPGPRRTYKMSDRLAAELLDAYSNKGTAIKRKQDMNRLAEANRAFAHFRW